MNTERGKSIISGKLIWAIILVLFGILLLIGLFKFGSILALFMVYPWILTKVSGVVFNQYLAQLIALPVAVVLVWTVLKLVFSFNQKKRNAGFIILAILFMIHSAFMFFVTREQYFQPLTGVPLKYYTTNPLTGEIQVFDQPIFDAFGLKAKVMDPQTTQEYKAREMYPNTEIPPEKIVNFFDRTTGRPLVWYYIDPDSSYHFFVRAGYSGITGEELKQVMSETVKNFFNTPKGGETKKRLSEPLTKVELPKSSTRLSIFDKIASFKGSLAEDVGFLFISFIIMVISIVYLAILKSASVLSKSELKKLAQENTIKGLREHPIANFGILFSIYFFLFLGFSLFVFITLKSWFWIATIIFLIGFFYTLLLAIIFYENMYFSGNNKN